MTLINVKDDEYEKLNESFFGEERPSEQKMISKIFFIGMGLIFILSFVLTIMRVFDITIGIMLMIVNVLVILFVFIANFMKEKVNKNLKKAIEEKTLKVYEVECLDITTSFIFENRFSVVYYLDEKEKIKRISIRKEDFEDLNKGDSFFLLEFEKNKKILTLTKVNEIFGIDEVYEEEFEEESSSLDSIETLDEDELNALEN